MPEIRLTTKDADLILSYFRDVLKHENEDYKDSLEMIKEEKENCTEKDIVMDVMLNVLHIDKKFEEIHQKRVEKYQKFIELLTVGSEV